MNGAYVFLCERCYIATLLHWYRVETIKQRMCLFTPSVGIYFFGAEVAHGWEGKTDGHCVEELRLKYYRNFGRSAAVDIYSDEPLPGLHRVLGHSSPLTGRYASTHQAHLSRVGVTIPLVSAFRPPHILNKTQKNSRQNTTGISMGARSILVYSPLLLYKFIFIPLLDSPFLVFVLFRCILWYPLPFPLFNWPFQTKINATKFDRIFDSIFFYWPHKKMVALVFGEEFCHAIVWFCSHCFANSLSILGPWVVRRSNIEQQPIRNSGLASLKPCVLSPFIFFTIIRQTNSSLPFFCYCYCCSCCGCCPYRYISLCVTTYIFGVE